MHNEFLPISLDGFLGLILKTLYMANLLVPLRNLHSNSVFANNHLLFGDDITIVTRRPIILSYFSFILYPFLNLK